jgi:hypothetical protein
MQVRDYQPEDKPEVEALFRKRGIEYDLPDFNDRQFVVRQVVIDDGRIVQALMARQTTELYYICDANWRTPLWRFHALGTLHKTMKLMLHMLGIKDVHIWIPPQLEKSFGRRLMRSFGWKRNLWTDYVREVK